MAQKNTPMTSSKDYTRTNHRLQVKLTQENSDFVTQRKEAFGVPYNSIINFALEYYRLALEQKGGEGI